MSPSSSSVSGRQALRRSTRTGDAGTSEIEPTIGNVVEGTEIAVRSRKRKKQASEEDPNGNPKDLTKEDKKSQKEALEDVGVSVGSKASRGRLLDLLDRHIIKKKSRLSSNRNETQSDPHQKTRGKTTKGSTQLTGARAHEDQPSETVDESPQPRYPDFELFSDQQLQQMVQGVGLDTSRVPRADLVKACKTYQQLIILPSGWDSFRFTADPHLTSASSQGPQDSITKEIKNSVTPDAQLAAVEGLTSGPNETEPETSAAQVAAVEGLTSSPKGTGAETSTSHLPSLERGNLLYPRPRPTMLSSSRSKGKSKARFQEESLGSDPDWEPPSQGPVESDIESHNPILEDMKSDIDVGPDQSLPQASTRKKPSPSTSTRKAAAKSREKPIPSTSTRKAAAKSRDETSSRTHIPKPSKAQNSNISPDDDGMLHMIFKLKDDLNKTNGRIKELEDEVEVLTQLTRKYIDVESEEIGIKKTRGGRISLSVRFHIDTLLGQGDNSRSLPAPATTAEKENWMSELDIHQVNFDLDSSDENPAPLDLEDEGPRHKDSSPQQISIMRQMMKAVEVSSFRPDFSQASTSKDNKWLWDLAFKIFIKLVECGEYAGISLDHANTSAIKKAFDTRVQSLMKRYREEAWDAARKKKTADSVRRSARLRYLKKSREKIVLSRQDLWPLSVMVQEGCSDDETEHEDCQDPLSGHLSSAVHIRKLAWRSAALQHALVRLDVYKGNIDSNTPKKNKSQSNNSSPTGRPSRPRIRCENGPISQVPAPAGLSIDCYSSAWLQTLSPLERSQLEIKSDRLLTRMMPVLNTL